MPALIAKACEIVPDLLQILHVVVPATRSVPEHPRGKTTITRNRNSKFDELRPAKRRMPTKSIDIQHKAGMPLEGARQSTRQRLDFRAGFPSASGSPLAWDPAIRCSFPSRTESDRDRRPRAPREWARHRGVDRDGNGA